MEGQSSLGKQAKFSRRIVRSSRRIVRSPMPNEHPDSYGICNSKLELHIQSLLLSLATKELAF